MCLSCREIIDAKLDLVLKCRKLWPMCASIDEDIKFRKEIWNLHFPSEKRQRITLYDNTNVSLRESSEAALHKSTRSAHYKEFCAKGGDACHPCGFNRGMNLVTGACPDSLHIKIVKTLEQQEEFQKYYLDGTEIKRMFINTFDKGYRLSIEAAHLNQVCL